MPPSPNGVAGPFLKWAGGKRQLLPQIRRFYPETFRRYVEPFVGSGAVFFDLHCAGRLDGRETLLVDTNADLIGCYRMVRDHTAMVAEALDALAAAHAVHGSTHYYAVRDQRFNPMRARLREPGGAIAYTPALAAMMIYLNRTGFNGLFRVNSEGHFNVPAGRYARPNIADRARLERAAAALAPTAVRLELASFTTPLEAAQPGDFIYLDPPYEPVSRTSSFTSYTASGFGEADQEQLRAAVITLSEGGCHVLLSNSTAERIARLYDGNPEVERAGLRAYRVPARRTINSVGSKRGVVEEYLITNIADHETVRARPEGE